MEAANLKVDQLRSALKERGLPSTGKKAELVDRLQGAIDSELLGEGENDPAESKAEKSQQAELPKAAAPVKDTSVPAPETPAKKPAPTPAAEAKPAAQTADSILGTGGASAAKDEKPPLSEEDIEKEKAKQKEIEDRIALEAEKRAKRAARFGIPVVVSKEEIELKKRQRAERFMSEEEKKRQERAKRFSMEKK
mmetsp:Transcript_21556/g.38081  ORF Transcript_21556/g.38081 Transcript_21556/m.38081 type:complete len:194 (-) Transcript_21556:229-810(-)|eukprot:CAMPEP_0184524566 /NCGR_PEP_ID=MMETSP0198_2-20121128/9594_1 /TAXON_ID=1112570 /ORGANISM="Thraustochytrium sp., Strain LLF1b" /LENGTH=193 /DNA_ID=CAMNT_0026915889 /DNA_START=107 /DNA_END=688 /DNA_ORIENTATION=+